MYKINAVSKKIFTKKAAVFGLDARIALAVLAIVSLSIGLSKQNFESEANYSNIKQEMNIIEAKFLKNWQEVVFSGVYTVPNGFTKRITGTSASNLPGFGDVDRTIRLDYSSTTTFSTNYNSTTYTHPLNGLNYITTKALYGVNLASFNNKTNLIYHNMQSGYYVNGNNAYIGYLMEDIGGKVHRTLSNMAKKEGTGLFSTVTNFEKDTSYSSSNLAMFSGKRYAKPHGIKFYFIVEHNIDSYSPSDFILHMVMYEVGENGKLDTNLPSNILELENYTGAAKDDIVHVFSTKDIYIKAKLENNKRLDEINSKIYSLAETTYLNRQSQCEEEVSPSADCDLNSDGNYDAIDQNMLLDYNPFAKSNMDTSGVNYYNNTTLFDYTTDSSVEGFLSSTLGLPEYYAYDLFGNVLRYQSNIGLKTTGPYTMEVWY